MKKILKIAALLFGLICSSGFAQNYMNFTAGIPLGLRFQNEKNGNDYLSISNVDFSVSGEFFHVFGKNFGLGAKVELSSGGFSTSDDNEEISYSETGITFAPSAGWVFGNRTIKKINIYPLVYQFYYLTEGTYKLESVSSDIEDGSFSIFKFGTAFSWQWGSVSQHGFETGFDVDYANIFKVDGKNKFSKAGSGFDVWIAYKFSFQI